MAPPRLEKAEIEYRATKHVCSTFFRMRKGEEARKAFVFLTPPDYQGKPNLLLPYKLSIR